MIRPFDLRDVPLVAQLETQGISMYRELALTRGRGPLQLALANYLSLHKRGDHTFVLPSQPAGFAQMRPHQRASRAIVTYIAPSLVVCDEAGEIWMRLLESLATAAGELGLQQLVAEVTEDTPEMTVLHRVGFAVFVRQDTLRLKSMPTVEVPNRLVLRPTADLDEWGIQQLYQNTVPRLAQQAESPPHAHHSGSTRGYVLEEGGEIVAYLEIRRGATGAWFNAFIHPQAEEYAQSVIVQGLTILGPQWTIPIYYCVRRYQEWLWDPLESLGFEPFGSTAVLVKRLVVPAVEERVPAHVLVQSKVTTPIVHSQDSHFRVKG